MDARKRNALTAVLARLTRPGLLGLWLVPGLALLLAGCPGNSGQQSDPVVVENPVAFVKRPLLFNNDGTQLRAQDLREPDAFRPGARLLLKANASPGASARDISSAAFAGPEFLNDDGALLYDVKDLDVSYDGTRLLFAMRAPAIEDADDDEQPTWNIWEYESETGALARVIASDVSAEDGQDVAPAYLPDGRIVFSSTRQRVSKAVLLDEGKPQYPALDEDQRSPAFVLHVMSSDGSDIEQITFNQSHDLDPTVLGDGRILFSRWDNARQTPANGVNLYQVNPDGTGLRYVYGRHSHDSAGESGSVGFLKPVEMDPQNMLLQARPLRSDSFSILPVTVDISRFVEADRTLEGAIEDGQLPLATGLDVFGEPRLRGSFGFVSPLFDGTDRYLASWSPCRLVPVLAEGEEELERRNTHCTAERLASEAYEAARPVYGLWVLDAAAGTQLPVAPAEEGQQFDEAVLLTERPLPSFIADSVLLDDARALAEAGFGIVNVRSVYDFDGVDITPAGIAVMADPAQTPPAQRPARFVRIEKPVSIPDDDVRDFSNSAFGRSRAQTMREILGYAPVEPDGSVRLAVPANVAFAISVLDGQGQRITQRHQNWLQVRPGETLKCHGCHTSDSEVPHGHAKAGPGSVNPGAATTGLEFPNTRPTLVADMGETMAETFTRINGARQLQPDIRYEDEWTDPAVAVPADSFSYAYSDLSTPVPVTAACAADWTSLCRTVIHYETHIHPLWGLERQVLAVDGVTVVDEYTCTGCHTSVDDQGATRIPEAQLDLTDGPSVDNADHFRAYRELLFTDKGFWGLSVLKRHKPLQPISVVAFRGVLT
jgi:hypothetical protein